jgi:hypothetical protein
MGAVGALGAAVLVWAATALVPSRPSLVMVVMDPLARPLACACVAGYAQRDYDALAGFLTRRLGQPVRAVYAESLDKPLQTVRPERLVLVIGKEAVVRADAQAVGLAVHPVAQLTGLDGATTQSGLFGLKRRIQHAPWLIWLAGASCLGRSRRQKGTVRLCALWQPLGSSPTGSMPVGSRPTWPRTRLIKPRHPGLQRWG